LAEQVECREVMELIRRLAGPDLEEVKLFDLYQGKQIEKGKKSMAFALVYRAADRTLTDTEVAEIHRRVVDGLKDKLQAGIR
jgi:phenylalanyl-tRNA synthetase beta chain